MVVALMSGEGEEDVKQYTVEYEPEPDDEREASPFQQNAYLLGLGWSVMFARYTIATFLSSFFPQEAQRYGISSTWTGLIFAAFPTGITLTSSIAPMFIRSFGIRMSIVFGLVATTACTVIFGLTPSLMGCPQVWRRALAVTND